MPKSTVAVSLVAVFLLGLLIGGRFDRSATADPAASGLDPAGNGHLVTADAAGESLTVWRLEGWSLAEGVRYYANGPGSITFLKTSLKLNTK